MAVVHLNELDSKMFNQNKINLIIFYIIILNIQDYSLDNRTNIYYAIS